MNLLYLITRIITFFGSGLRVLWEQIICRLEGVPVEDIRVFKNSELCAHAEHELPKKRKQSFWICSFPFTMNFILGFISLLSGSYRLFFLGDFSTFKSYIFVWIGVSLLANCAPSFEDALSLKDMFYNKETSIVKKILVSPLFAVYYASAWLEKYSITFVLAIVFAIFLPKMLNLLFPAIITVIEIFRDVE
ncbi:MAG: hypothetical protein KIG53_05950 [Oscillospiraceae bacterium]|nr:hypothetical protein [Oscillospiraceae bacterium]